MNLTPNQKKIILASSIGVVLVCSVVLINLQNSSTPTKNLATSTEQRIPSTLTKEPENVIKKAKEAVEKSNEKTENTDGVLKKASGLLDDTPIGTKEKEAGSVVHADEQTPKLTSNKKVKPKNSSDKEKEDKNNDTSDNDSTNHVVNTDTMPSIFLPKETIVINEEESFQPNNYFTVQGINASVTIENNVNIYEAGTYQVHIIASNSVGTAEKTIKVIVNARPKLYLLKEKVTIPANSTFNPLDFIDCVDKEDGNLTSKVKATTNLDTKKVGKYLVTYDVKDSRGFSAKSVTLEVEVTNTPANLLGVRNQTIHVFDTFDPLHGITAFDNEEGDLTDKIVVTGTVDNTVAGDYELTYTITDSQGETTSTKAIITVVNDSPVLRGFKDQTVHVFDKFDPLKDVRANDTEEGNLTRKIHVIGTVDLEHEGEYEITYEVEDRQGAKDTKKVKITVVNDSPVLHGVEDTQILLGSSFDPLKDVTVTDTEDGEIDKTKIVVTGTVNTNVLGEYTITYKVKDRNDKETTHDRIIEVVNQLPVAPAQP